MSAVSGLSYSEVRNSCADISVLVGKTLKSVELNDDKDELIFTTTDGDRFVQYHDQDCCETVEVEDICGDVADIIGSPILVATEETNDETNPQDWVEKQEPTALKWQESFTWTFYKIDTIKGGITIRWLGESNGYYSESVDSVWLKANNETP